MLRFVWDKEKATSNASKHGVCFEEAATSFADPFSMTIADLEHSAREQRMVTMGLSASGRVLVAIHVDRGDDIRIISAREATAREKRQYMNEENSDRAREIESEYDFGGGERGRYSERFAQGANVIVLDPDIAELFHGSVEVNDALRVFARLARRERDSRHPGE